MYNEPIYGTFFTARLCQVQPIVNQYFKITSWSALLLVLSCTSLFAQSRRVDSKAKLRRWTLSVSMGLATSGPSTEIERLLTGGQFNQNDANPFSGLPGQDHPYSLTGVDFQNGVPWMISSYYLVKQPVALGIIVAKAPLGISWGHRKPLYLGIGYSVTTVAPLVAFQLADLVRLGVGPALHKPKTSATGIGTQDRGTFESKLGYLLDLSLVLPRKGYFFGELKIQYRNVGRAAIGPFETTSLGFSDMLPVTEVNFTHWYIGIGFGVGT